MKRILVLLVCALLMTGLFALSGAEQSVSVRTDDPDASSPAVVGEENGLVILSIPSEEDLLSGQTDLTPAPQATPEGRAPVPTILPEQDDRPFIIRFGSRDDNKIALTMDDCYNLDAVRQTLELCREYGIVMTFYPIGIQLHAEDRDLWQGIIDAGCEIGTHTMRHVRFAKNEYKIALASILKPQQVLDELLGYHYPIRTIRTPYGSIEDETGNTAKGIRILKTAGYMHTVNWDVSETNPAKAIHRVQNGSILLYHARMNDVKCIRTLVPQLLEKGFEFVTVAELIGLGAEVATSTDLYVMDLSQY